MILKKQIPQDFYKLFRTRNMEAYMTFLVAIYEENSELYTALGLTQEEGCAIIEGLMGKSPIDWEDEELSEEEKGAEPSPSFVLRRFIRWGWLRSDYDEKLNTYVLSFPEYSQLYIELFEKMQREDDNGERESILSVYSALFTYHTDSEKNNEILKSALRTSKNLEQLLSNMQNGMRSYFEELSGSRNFKEIQQVLVEEINNNDSKRYAILTTTDSFYRYKEAVKELISRILDENERKKQQLGVELAKAQAGTIAHYRLEQSLHYHEEATVMVYRIEREFDLIERKYNRLIEQKAVFAARALARIRYIFQEGAHDEDNLLRLLQLLGQGDEGEQLLEDLADRISLSVPYKVFDDDSMYTRHEGATAEYHPLAPTGQQESADAAITDFVPKPLYTGRELHAFREKNTRNGVFTATKESVSTPEDLEKLMFLWQEATEKAMPSAQAVTLGEEIAKENGLKFTQLILQND